MYLTIRNFRAAAFVTLLLSQVASAENGEILGVDVNPFYGVSKVGDQAGEMFGLKKRKLTALLGESLQRTVRIVEATFQEIPKGYWEDPYILGYLTGIYQNMYPFAKQTVGQVSNRTRAIVMVDIFTSLSGSENVISMITEFKAMENWEFQRGENNAEKFLSLMLGLDDYLADPDVVRAKKKMEATPDLLKPPEIYGDVSSGEELAANYQDIIYLDYIRKRFQLDD